MSSLIVEVCKIDGIEPIEGADKIALAKVKNWNVVIKKEDFSVGDLAIYIPIDSIVPDVPTFEFLKDRHFRIKTIRLKGVYSQGILFPLEILSDFCDTEKDENGKIIAIWTE